MKNFFSFVFLGAMIIVVSWSGCKQTVESRFQKKMDASMNTLVESRSDSTGIWPEAGWWNSANLFTAVIRYAELTNQKKRFVPLIEDVFSKTRKFPVYDDKGNFMFECENYINDYYDDEGWWALAWIEAYKLTAKKEYLEMAETIFRDMTTGWSDDICQGGIYWKKNPLVYKNSIANNLFALTAIRLYHQTQKKEYAEWFEKEVNWYLDSGLYNTDNQMIEDGIDNKTNQPNRGRYYTYNQGVAIAVLTEMYLYKNDTSYLEKAEALAQSAIKNMTTEQGILCERNKDIAAGNDGVQFKGIFMRHLSFLYRTTGKAMYEDFILKNADSIISHDYDSISRSFGCYWYGPFREVKMAANSSALECVMEAEFIVREQQK